MPAYDLRQDHGDRHILHFASDAAACSYATGTTPRGVTVEVWEGARLVGTLTGQSEDMGNGSWYLANARVRQSRVGK
jgi:hypothetical protein